MNILNIKENYFSHAFALVVLCACIHLATQTDFVFSWNFLGDLAFISVLLFVYLWMMNSIFRRNPYGQSPYLLPISGAMLTLFPEVFLQPKVLVISILLLFVVFLLFRLLVKNNPALALVDVSLLIFIGALFQWEVILFLPIIWVAVIFYMPRRAKYLLIPFFAFISVICGLFVWDIFSQQDVINFFITPLKTAQISVETYLNFPQFHRFYGAFFVVILGGISCFFIGYWAEKFLLCWSFIAFYRC